MGEEDERRRYGALAWRLRRAVDAVGAATGLSPSRVVQAAAAALMLLLGSLSLALVAALSSRGRASSHAEHVGAPGLAPPPGRGTGASRVPSSFWTNLPFMGPGLDGSRSPQAWLEPGKSPGQAPNETLDPSELPAQPQEDGGSQDRGSRWQAPDRWGFTGGFGAAGPGAPRSPSAASGGSWSPSARRPPAGGPALRGVSRSLAPIPEVVGAPAVRDGSYEKAAAPAAALGPPASPIAIDPNAAVALPEGTGPRVGVQEPLLVPQSGHGRASGRNAMTERHGYDDPLDLPARR